MQKNREKKWVSLIWIWKTQVDINYELNTLKSVSSDLFAYVFLY